MIAPATPEDGPSCRWDSEHTRGALLADLAGAGLVPPGGAGGRGWMIRLPAYPEIAIWQLEHLGGGLFIGWGDFSAERSVTARLCREPGRPARAWANDAGAAALLSASVVRLFESSALEDRLPVLTIEPERGELYLPRGVESLAALTAAVAVADGLRQAIGAPAEPARDLELAIGEPVGDARAVRPTLRLLRWGGFLACCVALWLGAAAVPWLGVVTLLAGGLFVLTAPMALHEEWLLASRGHRAKTYLTDRIVDRIGDRVRREILEVSFFGADCERCWTHVPLGRRERGTGLAWQPEEVFFFAHAPLSHQRLRRHLSFLPR